MLEALVDALAWLGQFSDPLAWVVLGAFLLGGALDVADRRGARPVAVLGWAIFALFWLTTIHQFVVVQKSIIEGFGVVVAIPAALYAGYLLAEGRDSLFVMTRAIGLMGVVYLPFVAIDPLSLWITEVVTRQTESLMALLGQTNPADFQVVNGAQFGGPEGRNTFLFQIPEDNHQIYYTILVACTGVGSMAIFVGGILAVSAPWDRKLRALAVSVPVIYLLNLVRNVFIALSFGQQRFHIAPELVMTLFAEEDPYHVSYWIADRILAQSASVLALIAITYLVVRELPEVLIILEDGLYMLTNSEYDLAAALDLERPEPPSVRPESADD